jgi:hypothetical protein
MRFVGCTVGISHLYILHTITPTAIGRVNQARGGGCAMDVAIFFYF